MCTTSLGFAISLDDVAVDSFSDFLRTGPPPIFFTTLEIVCMFVPNTDFLSGVILLLRDDTLAGLGRLLALDPLVALLLTLEPPPP